MNFCQNCGKENESGMNFCRFCGFQFSSAQTQQLPNNEYSQPHPYMWKTDEFQIREHSARKTQEIQNIQPLFPPTVNQNAPQSLTYPQPNNFVAGYRCPRCGTTNLPFVKKQVSTAGWVTFAVLLVTTGILFWIGLLIKEDVKVCSVCGLRISSH